MQALNGGSLHPSGSLTRPHALCCAFPDRRTQVLHGAILVDAQRLFGEEEEESETNAVTRSGDRRRSLHP
jgi:hypothetical protein